MPVDPELRALNIDIPAQPESLVKLSVLLAEDEVNLQQVSSLIESDMALASAVLKAVNSSLYGLSGRVQSVHQAITYLGTREVAAVTFEMGLRAVFPGAPELAPIWERAAVRGLLMGRIGYAIGVDPWAAHSAGLFEECGKAVLFRHAMARYKMIAFLRRRAGREAMNDPLEDDSDLLGASDEEAREAKRDMATLLARLPDRHRLPIQLVKIEGLSVAEAAKRTGMSESAVKVGIHRGLKALAAYIRG